MRDLIFTANIEPPSDDPRWYVYGQGGGWLGRFTLPLWQHIMAEGAPEMGKADPDEVGGTSVSSLHAALASQGDLDKADELWADIDDHNALDGIKGLTGLSMKRGLWNMKGLQARIESLVHNRGPIPCRVGVCTREPFECHSLANTDAASAKQWQKWVGASTRSAFVL